MEDEVSETTSESLVSAVAADTGMLGIAAGEVGIED